jgi:glycosyltransferase involved in cell wall biosynthesis
LTKPRLIVIGPLPPPQHGVTISTALVLANTALSKHFAVVHLDTSDHRSGRNVGRWDLRNVALGVRSVVRLARALSSPPGTVYLPISQSSGAFLRDSLFIWLAVLRGWRVAIHLRGSEIVPFYRAQLRPYRWWMRRTLARVFSAAVVGNSLRGAFGGLVADKRVVVVANGTPANASELRPHNSSTVLFLSNLRRRKGVVEALAAACITADQVPDAHFVFAGAWEDRQLEIELREKARPLGDRIEFRATVSGAAKDDLLAYAAVLLFPPREPEGHPRVVLEAIAAGLPVVATDRGAIAETIEDGISGFVLPDPEPEALAEKLIDLLRDNDLQGRMSAASRDVYEHRFTQEIADGRLADWLTAVASVEQP